MVAMRDSRVDGFARSLEQIWLCQARSVNLVRMPLD